MKNLKGSKTEANLLAAFAGESMARNRYTFYASRAKKEGYEEIAQVFTDTAANEKEHAEIWFKLLHGGLANTAANLKDAAEGEHAEWTDMYKSFADEAEAEGFKDIANLFRMVGQIEHNHEQRYLSFLKRLEDGTVFKRSEPVTWVCRNCGHTHSGLEAPERCPVCEHPKAYFEVEA